ncbi:carbohydrate binding domain-containing protein [Pelagicoccus enzymogenes]|uniref:fibronectin type III domain-containing protein n=1 Tax=Pelagicoccus enzymogenes TaxID=2773457 RepID=UPI00280ECA65|nr:LamG-like jellyroll fold domain-containing protein [Pelagicoccus enzymogenes]MDQ8198908.1 carbohydrate binding domain-containing protein [Pelagicoccus enzymogenes]
MGDVDGDGDDDFFIADRRAAPSLYLYRNTESGWVRSVVDNEQLEIEAGGAVADIDGDGDLDLALGQDWRGGDVWWWENPGPGGAVSGRWTRRLVKSGGRQGHDQAFGDFDGDNQLEFVTWVNMEQRLEIYEIPSNRNTSPWPRVATIALEGEGIFIDDINRDGKVDILAAQSWIEHVSGNNYRKNTIDSSYPGASTRIVSGQFVPGGRPEVLIGAGDANGPLNFYQFIGQQWVKTELMEEIVHGHTLQVGDIDGDGNLDFFTAEMGDPGHGVNATAWIAWGDGAGGFEFEVLSKGIANHESKLADVDGDGDWDIISKPFNHGAPRYDIFINEGPKFVHTLNEWQRHLIDGGLSWQALDVHAGDLDDDGDLDIVTGGWWFQNPGSIGGAWVRKTIGPDLRNAAWLHDFDKDGDLDVFGSNGRPRGEGMGWSRNDGEGNFSYLSNVANGEGSVIFQGSLGASFDGGETYQVVMQWNGGEAGGTNVDAFTVPTNSIASQTWQKSVLSSNSLGEDMSAGDIDGDGDLDIFQGNAWLRNEGNGTSWTQFVIADFPASYGTPDRNDLVDIDGDGDLDAYVGLSDFPGDAAPLLWLECPEDPTQDWTVHIIETDVFGGYSMDAADVDFDGDIDVVLGEHRGATRALIFENVGFGSSWLMHTIDTGGTGIDHHGGTKFYDLDLDGDLDIVSIGWDNDKLWIYENQGTVAEDLEAPTRPANVTVEAVVGPSLLVEWSASTDNQEVEKYLVYRGGVLLGETESLYFLDTEVSEGASYAYSVVAVDGNGNESSESSAVNGTGGPAMENWWNTSWAYRTLVAVDPNQFDRGDAVVDLEVDFTALLAAQGVQASIKSDALRIVEVDEVGSVLDASVPVQFDPTESYDPLANARGRVIFPLEGETPSGTIRYFFLYFTQSSASVSPLAFDPQVALVEGVPDEGQDSYRITNLTGELFYHPLGGGFSSWEDIEGNDWIDYHPTGQASGNYRGIPNMIYPEDNFHPGSTDSTSVVEISGPLKTTLRTMSDDGDWEATWEIYGRFAKMTMLKAPRSYWFLYEGAPGGSFDATSDFVVRSNGVSNLVSESWQNDLVDEEWVYVSDPALDRSLVVAHAEDDDSIDSYRPFGGDMTVLGFGRNIGLESYLSGVPHTFYIALVEGTEFAETSAKINSIYKPLLVKLAPVSAIQDTEVPSVPGAVRIDAMTTSTVTLSWEPSSDNLAVVGYNVYRVGTSSPIGFVNTESFTDTGRNANTAYSYFVRAVDDGGNESESSVVVSGTTATAGDLPSKPSGLNAVNIGSTEVELSWNPATDNVSVAGYRLFRDGNLVGTSSSNGFTDTGLNPGTRYQYQVQSIDGELYVSALSNSLSPTTVADTTPPSQPSGLVVSNETETSLRIGWNESSDNHLVALYRVYRDGTLIGDTASAFFQDFGLLPDTTYRYTVESVDVSGNVSSRSNGALGSTVSDTISPSVPDRLALEILNTGGIQLSWAVSSDNVGVAGYQVFRDGSLLGEVADATFVDETVLPETVYSYRVVALDLSGNASGSSDSLTLRTVTQPDPDLWLGLDFEEENGALVFDVTPNAHDGAITDYVERVEDGKTGRALDFLGGGGFVDMGNVDIPGTNMALTAWILADNFDVSDSRVISKATGPAANDHYWMLSTINSGGIKLRMRLKTNDGGTDTLIGSRILVPGEWIHVAATYDGVNMRLYVNGELDAELSKLGTISQAPSVPVAIGNQPQGDRSFDGLIDDVRIYTRALDELDIAAVMASSSSVVGNRVVSTPSTPSQVQAIGVSQTEVNVSWEASSDDGFVALYKVFRDGVEIGETASTSFLDTGLEPDTVYGYGVQAVDNDDSVSSVSSTVNGQTLPSNPNVVLDGGFEGGLGSWSFYTNGSGDADTSSPGYLGQNAARIHLITGGSNIQLYQNDIHLLPDTRYRVSFAAYSSSGRDLRLSLSKHSSPYSNYGMSRELFDLGTEWQSFSFEFTTLGFAAPVEDGRLFFWFASDGRAGDTYYIDNVSLSPINESGGGDAENPSAPSNVSVSLEANLSARLTWSAATDNVGVTEYRVFRDGSLLGIVSTTSFLDSGLSPAARYEYSVVALDAAGNLSAQSEKAVLFTPSVNAPPTVPLNVQASGSSTSQIAVSWDASSDDGTVVEYRVLRDGALVGTVSTTSFTDSGLSAGTSYGYQVQAIDNEGVSSGLSSTVSGATLSDTIPGPSSSVVENGGFEDGMSDWSFYTSGTGDASLSNDAYSGSRAVAISLATAASNIQLFQNGVSLEANTRYRLSFAAYSNSGRDLRVSLAKHSSPYTVYGLNRERFDLGTGWSIHSIEFTTTGFGGSVSNGRLYFWFASDARAGDVYYIDSVVLAPVVESGGDTEPPSAPDGLAANLVSGSEVSLSWNPATDNVGVAGYRVYQGNSLLDTVPGTSFQVEGLAAATTYNFSVAAIDAAQNESLRSSSVLVETPALNAAPSTPTGVSASGVSVSEIDVAWNASSDDGTVVEYKVFRDGNEVGVSSGLSFRDQGLEPGNSYDYTVLAVDDTNLSSNQSSPVTGSTLVDTSSPSVPSGLIGSVPATGGIGLSWNPSTDNVGVAGYLVFRNGTPIGEVAGTSLFDSLVVAGTSYEYRVLAFDEAGNESSLSAPESVQAAGAVSVDPDLWLGMGFEEGTGALVFDISPNQNDGVVDNSVVRVEQGRFGEALGFSGSGGFVDLENLDIPGNSLTIASWIYADSFAIHDARVVSKAVGVNEDDHFWMLSTIGSGGNKLRFRLKTDGGVTQTLVGNSVLPINTWTHVAATFDGSEMRVYVNGQLDGTLSHAGSIALDSSVPAVIGDQPQGGRSFDGRIDDLRIYRRALSASELQQAMNGPIAPVGVSDSEAPSVPEGLAATSTSATEIDLSWQESTDNVGVLGYLVYRDGENIGQSIVSSFSDSGLNPSTEYDYQVSAFDLASNESALSASVSETTGSGAGNALLNGHFDSDLSDWSFYTNTVGEAVVDSNGYGGSVGSAKIVITQAGSNIQLFQNGVSLKPNANYQLRFVAYSNSARDLRISLSKHSSPYTNYGLNRVRFDLSTGWQEFAFEFQTENFSSMVSNGRFYFWFSSDARAGDVYWIDAVELIEL